MNGHHKWSGTQLQQDLEDLRKCKHVEPQVAAPSGSEGGQTSKWQCENMWIWKLQFVLFRSLLFSSFLSRFLHWRKFFGSMAQDRAGSRPAMPASRPPQFRSCTPWNTHTHTVYEQSNKIWLYYIYINHYTSPIYTKPLEDLKWSSKLLLWTHRFST